MFTPHQSRRRGIIKSGVAAPAWGAGDLSEKGVGGCQVGFVLLQRFSLVLVALALVRTLNPCWRASGVVISVHLL